jgi:hypothetical protein
MERHENGALLKIYLSLKFGKRDVIKIYTKSQPQYQLRPM